MGVEMDWGSCAGHPGGVKISACRLVTDALHIIRLIREQEAGIEQFYNTKLSLHSA